HLDPRAREGAAGADEDRQGRPSLHRRSRAERRLHRPHPDGAEADPRRPGELFAKGEEFVVDGGAEEDHAPALPRWGRRLQGRPLPNPPSKGRREEMSAVSRSAPAWSPSSRSTTCTVLVARLRRIGAEGEGGAAAPMET